MVTAAKSKPAARLPAKSPAVKRRPRDSVATKTIILKHALREFADKGFDGARIERIVKAAGINVSLAYQYFGSKSGLFIAVMEQAYGTMRANHRDIDIRDLAPEEAMQTLVRSTFRIFVNYPEIIGLLNSENVHRAAHIAKSPYIKGLYNPLLDTIGMLVAKGAREGIFRNDVDPQDLFISMTGMGYFYLSNKYTLSVILGRDLKHPDALQRHENHIVSVVLGYLRA
jgi:TetR/AcrR family transcriptional regulator